jgi:hypothetical protein
MSSTRGAVSAGGVLRTRSPKPMLSATVMWGNSASCWKTNPTPRSRAGTRSTRRSPIHTPPVSGSSRPATMRRIVLLPPPDGPSSATSCPSSTWKETSRTTGTPPNAFHGTA